MNESLPFFKYHPDPLATGAIKAEPTLCPVCGRNREFAYDGPFYARDSVTGICPWCIADGFAAKKFDGSFQDAACCEDVDSREFLDELTKRTPGYCGWQQESWLSHCGDFCAYIGYADWRQIERLVAELSTDIQRVKSEMRIDDHELAQSLMGGSLYAYLFKCIHCGRHRITFDLD